MIGLQRPLGSMVNGAWLLLSSSLMKGLAGRVSAVGCHGLGVLGLGFRGFRYGRSHAEIDFMGVDRDFGGVDGRDLLRCEMPAG